MTMPPYPQEPEADPASGQPTPPPAGYPSAPAHPSNYPIQPSQPYYPPAGYPGQFSQPLPPGMYPGQVPGQFSQPLPPGMYPGQMPGQFSQPYPPGVYPGQMPGQFSQPYPPGVYPGQMPGQFSQPYPPGMYPGAQPWPVGVATMEPPAPKIPWYSWLAQPLPLWARLTLVGVFILGLIAAFATGSDWAAGGLHAGLAAGGVFVLVALATGVRALAGMASATNPQRGRQMLGAGLVGVILLATSGAGIGLQNPLHRLQASVLEKGGQFAHSIKEYQLAGETVPGSHDIARVYDAWGEHDTAAEQYDQAIAHFALVITTYTGATTEVNRAQTDSITAYTSWGKQAADVKNYANAVQRFDMLLDQAYCQASCQVSASALDATAYYQLAEQTLTNADYPHAVQAFTTLQTRFPAAPEAGQIHTDFAKALLGFGVQTRTGPNCSDALQTYNLLATKYADTPQGKQAAHDLKLPQAIIGHFSEQLPPHSFVVAFLGRNLNFTMSNNAFFTALIAGTPIKADGSFAFAPQPLGTYSLYWATIDSTGTISGYFYYHNDSVKSDYYQATVGPLCPFDFGQIDDPIIHQSSVGAGNLFATHSRSGLLDGPSTQVNILFAPTTRRV